MRYLMIAALISANAFADTKALEDAIHFFKANVNGKTVSATTNDEDSDFTQTWKYENLGVSGNGFTYDEKVDIKQTVYELDADGNRKQPGDQRNRSYKVRTEIGHREGTDLLLGFKRFLESSFRDTTGSFYTASVELDGDKLVINFDDGQPSTWPKNPPATGVDLIQSKHVETLWIDEAGKLNRKFTQVTEILDPKTLEVLKTKPQFVTEQKEN